MLLVDAHEARRRLLEAHLRDIGCKVYSTCTPLGAIARACEAPVGVLVLGRPHGAAGAADLLDYFAEADPSIRRVLIWESAEVDGTHDVALSLAHALLPVPWTRTDLRALAPGCAGGSEMSSKEMKP